MNIAVVGASGYLGSELLHQARQSENEVIGTSRSSEKSELKTFELDDNTTWQNLIAHKPDYVIWTAWTRSELTDNDPFKKLLGELATSHFVYVSSDAAFCQKTLNAESELGNYARRKKAEQDAVLAKPGSLVFVTGPIYGETHMGELDGRTKLMLNRQEERVEYWANLFKTFVPVNGLARTILNNLSKTGLYFVGPPERTSYFDFYIARAKEYGRSTANFSPANLSIEEIDNLNFCQDTSYSDYENRLWE